MILAPLAVLMPLLWAPMPRVATFYLDTITADGSAYDADAMTCADSEVYDHYKTGYGRSTNHVYVWARFEDRRVRLEVNDKMHRRFYGKRIDLTPAAAFALTGDRPGDSRYGKWHGVVIEKVEVEPKLTLVKGGADVKREAA